MKKTKTLKPLSKKKMIEYHGYYHNEHNKLVEKGLKDNRDKFTSILKRIEAGYVPSRPEENIKHEQVGSSYDDNEIGGALATPEQKIQGQKFAIFAMLSYIPDIQDKIDYLKSKGKTDWDIDKSLTDQNGTDYLTTIVNRQTGQVIVSIRGTIWSQLNDVLTNLGFVFGVGRLTPKANEVMYQVSKVLQKYGKGRVLLTGHSQGGELARQNANRFGLPAVIFNRAASMMDVFNVKNPNILEFDTNYGAQFDIVSWFSHLQQKHNKSEFLVKEGNSAHTLENYIPETEQEIAQTGTGRRKY
jgi:hypothetical protein